jgi:hypothetical protein
MKKILLVLMFALPLVVGAHGGEQRVVDGKYIVTMSRAPFTPRAGVPIKLLISISDIVSGNVLDREAVMRIRVAKLASPGDAPQFVFEEKDIKAERSTLGYSYTFGEAGFHEIYIDFAFVDSPTKVMSAQDYLLDVQSAQQPRGDTSSVLWGFGGLLLGAVFTKIVLARKGKV